MRVLVLGAGISGLSAALHLPRGSVTVLEAEQAPGGVARTRKVGGFLFDRVGQFVHARDERVKALFDRLIPDGLSEHKRNAAIRIGDAYVPHPFQAHLAWLPDHLRRECLDAFVKAHREAIANPARKAQNLFDWFRWTFGDGIVKHFLEPQNRKSYCCELTELTCEWVNAFVPQPSAEQIVSGARVKGAQTELGYNAEILYPRIGGIQRIPEAMAAELDDLQCSKRVIEVVPDEHRVHCSDGTSYHYDRLISTMPLTDLVALTAGLSDDLRAAAGALRSADVLDVALGIDRPVQVPYQWIYFPEGRIPIARAVLSSNVSASSAPPGKSVIHLEANFRSGESPDADAIAQAGFETLRQFEIVPADSRVEARYIDCIRCAYVIHDRHRETVLPAVQAALHEVGILSIGRYGGWRYCGIESAMIEGMEAAAALAH